MAELPPIFVAEDNDDDFFFFRRAARTAGLENPIFRFRDGSEMVAFLGEYPRAAVSDAPFLAFVDLSMPVMNGFDVLGWLKKDAAHRFMPVVLSGSRRDEDVARAYALGAEEYLVKPVSPLVLAALAARPRAVQPV